MRLAIISDIHGNYDALQAVLRDLDHTKPDRIINLGDLIFRGPQPAECLDELDRLGAVTILGNTDEFFDGDYPERLKPLMDYTFRQVGDRDLTALTKLPFSHTEALPGGDLLCVHGSPRFNTEPVFPWTEDEKPEVFEGVTAPIIALGHQHLQYQYRQKSGHLVLSVGSVGFPFDGDPRAAYTLVDAEEGRFTATAVRVDYDRRKLLALAESRGYPDMPWLNQVLETGRV